LRRRNPAARSLSKDTVAIARDPTIDRSGNDPQYREQPPGKAKAFVDAQHGIAILPHPIAVHDENGARFLWVHAAFPVNFRANTTLRGRQPKMPLPIVLQHELRVRRTQHTFGVENDDWTAPSCTRILHDDSTRLNFAAKLVCSRVSQAKLAMRAKAHKVELFSVRFVVDQNQVRPDVAITMIIPIPRQGVIKMSARQRFVCREEIDDIH
jgi:hypothetical protein